MIMLNEGSVKKGARSPSLGLSSPRSGLAAGDILDAANERGAVPGLAYYYEDGVVASHGPDDFRPPLEVDGLGDGLGAAGEGLDDDDVPDAIGALKQMGQEALEGGRDIVSLTGGGVVAFALSVGNFDEAQLAQITREGRLCDLEALLAE